MPELHDLKPTQGSRRDRKRVGRGPGSGNGKTSGRGHKGQGSRSGGSVRPGFEGGQMPLQRRIPKRGFTNINRKEFQVVNVRDISRLDAGEVTPEVLQAHGVIRKADQLVKVLGMGQIEGAYQVSAHRFSNSAREKIEAAGGTVTVLSMGAEGSSRSGGAEGPAAQAAEASVEEAKETGDASSPPGEGEEAAEAEEEQA